MPSLSQALPLGYLPSPHSAFQEHAAHTAGWPAMLSSKGSLGTCIPKGVSTFLGRAFTAHNRLEIPSEILRVSLSMANQGTTCSGGRSRRALWRCSRCASAAIGAPTHLASSRTRCSAGCTRRRRRREHGRCGTGQPISPVAPTRHKPSTCQQACCLRPYHLNNMGHS